MFIAIENDFINLDNVACISRSVDYNHYKGYEEYIFYFVMSNGETKSYTLDKDGFDRLYDTITSMIFEG